MRISDLVVALVLSLVASAAVASDVWYVNNPRSADGERGAAVLWDSQTSQQDCVEATVGRVQRQLQAMQTGEHTPYAAADLMPQDPCASGQQGTLTQGTMLEILTPSEECGSLTKVHVLSGKNTDRVGCMPGDRLSAERVP